MSVPPSSRAAAGRLCLPARAFRGRSGRARALSGALVRKNASSFSLRVLSHVRLSPPAVQEEKEHLVRFQGFPRCAFFKEKPAVAQILFSLSETCVCVFVMSMTLRHVSIQRSLSSCTYSLLSTKRSSSCGEKGRLEKSLISYNQLDLRSTLVR